MGRKLAHLIKLAIFQNRFVAICIEGIIEVLNSCNIFVAGQLKLIVVYLSFEREI